MLHFLFWVCVVELAGLLATAVMVGGTMYLIWDPAADAEMCKHIDKMCKGDAVHTPTHQNYK